MCEGVNGGHMGLCVKVLMGGAYGVMCDGGNWRDIQVCV